MKKALITGITGHHEPSASVVPNAGGGKKRDAGRTRECFLNRFEIRKAASGLINAISAN
jgi:hypothetical protein